jgi:ribosomal protein S13
MREVDIEEARKIDLQSALVLARKIEGCQKSDLAEDCFKVFISGISIKSSKEALAAMRLAFDAASKDLSEKKISKIEARVKTNGNLISILERVDLKKSWIGSYEVRSRADIAFVDKLKVDFVQSMKETRSIMVDVIEGSSKSISQFKAKSRIAKDLTKEAGGHLRKIKVLRDNPYHL